MASSPDRRPGRAEDACRPGRVTEARRPGRGNRRDGPGPNLLLLALLAAACASPSASRPVGDPARGREVFVARDAGHCVLCHEAPGVPTAGDVGPSMAGIGSRLGREALRVRVADITRVHPDSVMPTFHRTEGLRRVSKAHEGKPVLDAQQLEDVVVWLETLK